MSQKPESNFHVEQSAATDDSIQQVHAQLRSQKPEKTGGYPMFPLVLLGFMCTVAFFGSIYMVHNSVRFDPLVVNEHAKREKAGPETGPGPTPPMLGKRVYLATCATCHQPNGQGVPGQFPPLAGSDWAVGSEERIIRIVLHGLNGPIKVSGHDFNSAMAPLGAVLKDDQIANVLSYVRDNAEWGNKAAWVTPETVGKVRAATADRKASWTADELLKIGN
jgi:cytochrome c553